MRNFSKSISKYYPIVFLYGLLSNGNNNLLLCSYILNFYGDNNWLMGTQFNILIFFSFIIIKLKKIKILNWVPINQLLSP